MSIVVKMDLRQARLGYDLLSLRPTVLGFPVHYTWIQALEYLLRMGLPRYLAK